MRRSSSDKPLPSLLLPPDLDLGHAVRERSPATYEKSYEKSGQLAYSSRSLCPSPSAISTMAAAPPVQQVCGPNTSNNYMTRLPGIEPGYIIAAGHCLAVVAVAAICFSASVSGNPERISAMGLVFFALSAALRTIIFNERVGETKPYSPGGVEMSLGAASLFVANAAAGVATMVDERKLLMLTSYAALDVSANWLYMVACAKTPSLPRFRAIVLAVSLVNDAFVTSLISRHEGLSAVCFPGFILRSVLNLGLLIWSAKVVVERDSQEGERKKSE